MLVAVRGPERQVGGSLGGGLLAGARHDGRAGVVSVPGSRRTHPVGDPEALPVRSWRARPRREGSVSSQVVSAVELTKRYRGRDSPAVDGISFEIAAGETVG